jgi:hypothetical protein
MPPCGFYKTNGQPCQHQAVAGQQDIPDHIHACRVHGNAHRRTLRLSNGIQPMPMQCCFFRGGGWCVQQRQDGSQYCPAHILHYGRVQQRRQNRDEQRQRYQDVLADLLGRNPRPTIEAATVEMFHRQDLPELLRYRVAAAYSFEVDVNDGGITFRRIWWELERAAAPPPPPPPPRRGETLGALSRDSQNVHTRFVVEQTNATEALLLAVPIPSDQQTEPTLAGEWIRLLSRQVSWGRILKTLTDVHAWFGKPSCRQENDNLYRRLLRSTVAKINRTGDMRDELYRRLWEECTEATGMCCEGHISRLCNVFVGFDEAFQPPIPLGELMQQKMAAIAGMEISEDEKRQLANAWFDEVAVPAQERVAWLDAF